MGIRIAFHLTSHANQIVFSPTSDIDSMAR